MLAELNGLSQAPWAFAEYSWGFRGERSLEKGSLRGNCTWEGG